MLDDVAGEKFTAANYSSGKVVITSILFQNILLIINCRNSLLFWAAWMVFMAEIHICKMFIFSLFMIHCRIKKTSVLFSTAVSSNNTDRMNASAISVRSHIKLGI